MLTCFDCPYYYYDHRDANGEYPGPDFPYCHWEPKGPDDLPLCEEEDYWAEARYEN